MTSSFFRGDLPRVRTVKRFASDILLSTISASISENRKSSRTLSQSRTSSSSFASISQVLGSLSGSDAGSSFLFSTILASALFIYSQDLIRSKLTARLPQGGPAPHIKRPGARGWEFGGSPQYSTR